MVRLHIVSLIVLGFAAGANQAWAQDVATTGAPTLPPAPAAPALAGAPVVSPIMQAPLEASRQAIEECRQKRLRRELPDYKASAECSNPQIFAAWQAANYPHMDLIAEWLNARELASEQVDQHRLTPKQFEEQMDALTVRLTAEENRRHAGLLATADNQLQLQLPAAAQVVGVATPAGQDKLAGKKSAAARARSVASAQGAGAPARGSIASLAAVNSVTPEAQAGVGGPFIPVDPNSPAARAVMARIAARAAPGEGSSGLYAQVAAQRSDGEARLVFRALQAQYPALLGGRDAVIRRVDDADQGSFYRVEIGPLSSGEADGLCGNLKAAGAQCVPRYE